MFRNSLIVVCYLLIPALAFSQITEPISRQRADSLTSALKQSDNDSLKMTIYRSLAAFYIEKSRDSAIYFLERQLAVSKKINQPLWQGWALTVISYELQHLGNFPEAFEAANDALTIAENEKNEYNMYPMQKEGFFADPHKVRICLLANIYQKFGHLYRSTGNDDKAMANYLKAISISETVDDHWGLSLYHISLGNLYAKAGKHDSAIALLKKSLDISKSSGYTAWMGWALIDIGRIYLKKKNYDTAGYYFKLAAGVSREQNNPASEADSDEALAEFFITTKNADSTIIYAHQALEIFRPLNDPNSVSNNYAYLSSAYQMKGNKDSTLKYLLLSKRLKDSLTLVERAHTSRYQHLNFEEQLRLQQVEKDKIKLQADIRMYAMLAGIAVFMLIAFLLYRNNNTRKKANGLLQIQKENLQSALSELKSTQSQLIQAEKMASLGELTAGIAHEIQNPLNFVNNFSEVSVEMIEEARALLASHGGQGKRQEAKENSPEVAELMIEIKQNLEKITHHGKRADAIVKNMMQHSRTASGVKEPTDINALADEYLRLAYHGFRSRDKEINVALESDFDESIEQIRIVPQDIGRVLLNLYNNALYAVSEKTKITRGFKARVRVTTRKQDGMVEIVVQDNGCGITSRVIDKIFQPFFTTKPTGSGTGLGLSLSYDIIKAHQGEITVESKEGEYTHFTLLLPA